MKGNIVFYWFCDILELCRMTSSSIDWNSFGSLTRDLRVQEEVHYAFGALYSNFGMPISSSGFVPSKLKGMSLHGLINFEMGKEIEQSNFLPVRMQYVKSVFSEYGIGYAIYYVFRVLFPSKEHIKSRYQAESANCIKYYATHIYERFRRAFRSAYLSLRS